MRPATVRLFCPLTAACSHSGGAAAAKYPCANTVVSQQSGGNSVGNRRKANAHHPWWQETHRPRSELEPRERFASTVGLPPPSARCLSADGVRVRPSYRSSGPRGRPPAISPPGGDSRGRFPLPLPLLLLAAGLPPPTDKTNLLRSAASCRAGSFPLSSSRLSASQSSHFVRFALMNAASDCSTPPVGSCAEAATSSSNATPFEAVTLAQPRPKRSLQAPPSVVLDSKTSICSSTSSAPICSDARSAPRRIVARRRTLYVPAPRVVGVNNSFVNVASNLGDYFRQCWRQARCRRTLWGPWQVGMCLGQRRSNAPPAPPECATYLYVPRLRSLSPHRSITSVALCGAVTECRRTVRQLHVMAVH